jgi:hypothetical protein
MVMHHDGAGSDAAQHVETSQALAAGFIPCEHGTVGSTTALTD